MICFEIEFRVVCVKYEWEKDVKTYNGVATLNNYCFQYFANNKNKGENDIELNGDWKVTLKATLRATIIVPCMCYITAFYIDICCQIRDEAVAETGEVNKIVGTLRSTPNGSTTISKAVQSSILPLLFIRIITLIVTTAIVIILIRRSKEPIYM